MPVTRTVSRALTALTTVALLGFSLAAPAIAASSTGQARAAAILSAPIYAAPPNIPDANVMAHMQQFQAIADRNGGNRAHGRPGYRASIDYVKGKLDAAGFRTTLQSFTHNGATGWNLTADWTSGDANQVVFLGAHLDSVTAGPGMNDNASGSAAALETALAVSREKLVTQKKLRFGWWGAEELGLIGSRYYVNALPAAERAKIKSYLNFDMVGARGTTTWGVYNDNASIQQMFQAYFRGKGIPTRTMSIGGRSDHASFARVGVPVGGIGSGNDPCYHQRCDTITNVAANVMGVATNAAAHSAWTLAGATVAARQPAAA
ncbi:M28 family peptidase [Crossiella cryophila]|uniref:Aminopeptidase S n=1 Tax=Crossiella cryophila TaxID=43355 RepID=A0A7W7CHB7_9PSEU|nr:M28 family peptidase [Crossiella cryophila]MBB4681105.1 aminopeptidase S [Crossiella cryophila]